MVRVAANERAFADQIDYLESILRGTSRTYHVVLCEMLSVTSANSTVGNKVISLVKRIERRVRSLQGDVTAISDPVADVQPDQLPLEEKEGNCTGVFLFYSTSLRLLFVTSFLVDRRCWSVKIRFGWVPGGFSVVVTVVECMPAYRTRVSLRCSFSTERKTRINSTLTIVAVYPWLNRAHFSGWLTDWHGGTCRENGRLFPLEMTLCGHSFCRSCVWRWARTQISCPVCQWDLL